MKKILSWLILLILLIPTWSWAASYYGCASAAINADNTFCTTPTGSCTGTTAVSAATALAGTNTLFVNGCTITIPNDADVSITATKISNKDDGGDMVDGGQITYTTSASYTATITADLEAGATTDLLAISGSAAGAARVTIVGDLTGGSGGTGINAVIDSKTGATASVVVQGNITGGAGASSHAYSLTGSTGLITHSGGNITGATGYGLYFASGTSGSTVEGNVIGSDTSPYGIGIYHQGTGSITITGNLINGTASTAVGGGKIIWTPDTPADEVTGHYIKFDGGGTAVYAGKNTDDATKALSTFYYIDPTDGTSDQGSASGSGGGGAWGF